MNNKKVNRIVNHEEGYIIYFDDYSTKFVKLNKYVNKYGFESFAGFKNEEVVLEYLNSNSEKMKLIFFEEKLVELQEKFACPKCVSGWLEITDSGEGYDCGEEYEDEYGCISTRTLINWYKDYSCTKCNHQEIYSGTESI